jgi:hypothetical protein
VPPSESFCLRFAAPQRAPSTQPVSRTPVGSDTHSTPPTPLSHRRRSKPTTNNKTNKNKTTKQHPRTRSAPLSPPR